MDDMKPKVSIIMGIYNCSSTLKESIHSLLEQTYTDWELIMCDDGSTDRTFHIAKEYADEYENITLLTNEKNRGLAFSLNRCLSIAKGEYIARQDGDDRSLPTRLEKEVTLLNDHPEFDIVSTGMIFFDETGYWGEIRSVEKPEPIDLVVQSPFCHAPCIVRKEALLRVNGYSLKRMTHRAEDYDLWFRMYANGSRGYNIQSPLYEVRDDRQAISRRKYMYRINEAYVRIQGYRRLNLPSKCYFYAVRTLIIGLIPKGIYKRMRRKKYSLS